MFKKVSFHLLPRFFFCIILFLQQDIFETGSVTLRYLCLKNLITKRFDNLVKGFNSFWCNLIEIYVFNIIKLAISMWDLEQKIVLKQGVKDVMKISAARY